MITFYFVKKSNCDLIHKLRLKSKMLFQKETVAAVSLSCQQDCIALPLHVSEWMRGLILGKDIHETMKQSFLFIPPAAWQGLLYDTANINNQSTPKGSPVWHWTRVLRTVQSTRANSAHALFKHVLCRSISPTWNERTRFVSVDNTTLKRRAQWWIQNEHITKRKIKKRN